MDERDRIIYARAARLGLSVDAHRPDGGRKRYRFTAPSGHTSQTLIGADSAETFLDGYQLGSEETCTLQTPSLG